MIRASRSFRIDVFGRVLGIAGLAAILFMAGCTTNSNSTPTPTTPSLTGAASAVGNVNPGQTGATYAITVSNAAGAAATSGVVTVTDPPTNFTVTAISGTGWTCTLATLSCTRSDALAAGQSYPPITVTGNVTGAAGQSISIPITIMGGGLTSTVNSSASVAIVSAPSISKAFNPASIGQNAPSALTFTITNPAANTVALTGVAFTDSLPAGLVVATPNALANTCSGTTSAVAGSGSISLSGGTVATASNCTVTVNVTAALPGTFPNISGAVTSTNGGTGNTASATLTVVAFPTISKAFGASTILLSGSTSLTFSITNPAANTAALTGVAFTDALPAGLVVATPNLLANTCGGTATATAGSSAASLSGATIAANSSCTLSLNVTGTTAGVKANTTGAISSTQSGAGPTSNTATVTVIAPPSISKAFGATGVAVNGTTSLTFTLTNPAANTVALAGVAFTDALPSGLVVTTPNGLTYTCSGTATAVAGSGNVSLSGGTIAVGATCTLSVNVKATQAGSFPNTTGAVSSTNGGTGTASNTATLNAATPPTISKAFGASTILLNTSTSLTFTITNPAANTLALTGVQFSDALTSGLMVAATPAIANTCGGTATAVAGSSSVSLTGATVATNSNCTLSVNVTGTTAGAKMNTTGAISSTQSGAGATSNTATLTVNAPPTISKAFGAGAIVLNASTSLTFTINNPNASTSLSGVAFTDMLVTGLQVSSPSNGLTGSCGSGTITAVAASSSVSLTGGTLGAGGSCTFSINVTGTAAGTFNNTTSAITSTETGAGATSNTATLTVFATPAITTLSSNSGPVGSPITITGTNFGTTQAQGSSTVTVNGVTATATSWSPTSITVTVPAAATGTGDVIVTVLGVATATSNATHFTVLTCTTNCALSGTVTGAWGAGVKIALTGTATVSTTTATDGTYSFANLAAGSYTITPSLTGYSYTPVAPVVNISGNTIQNFTATSAITSYSISGAVTYAGSTTGTIIISVYQNCLNCGTVGGTSIPAQAGAFTSLPYTVRGLPPTGTGGGGPGSYIVHVEIDHLGKGTPNESNPAADSGTVTLPSANATGVNITVSDRTQTVKPPTPTQFSVAPQNNGAVVQYKPSLDSAGQEMETSFKVYYGPNTDASGGAVVPFTAQGEGNTVFILSGLTNGLTYFKLSAVNGAGEGTATTPVAVTLGPSTVGTFTVSGTVSYPTTVTPTGPLYVGVYSNNGIYAVRIPTPLTNPQSYNVPGVPNGNYSNFAVIDMNNDGEIDAGDITNVNGDRNPSPITVNNANVTGNLNLNANLATTSISTFHQLFNGGNTYNINPAVSTGTKLPVSMTLFSGPNIAVPYDMSADRHNSNQTPLSNNARPLSTDIYQFLVTFSDGTSQIMTNTGLTVLDAFAQNLVMNTPVAGTATVPVLNWTAPASPPASYTYTVGLSSTTNTSPENWFYSGAQNNGIPSTTTNVQYNVDGKANPNSPLVPGMTYDWSVEVRDDSRNSAKFITTYLVPGGVGPATQLVFTQAPGNTTAGATFPVSVSIKDSSGNVVTSATNQITITLNNAGGAILSGGGPVSPVNGVATFSLSINNAGTGYTLSASASSPPALTGATSIAFNVAGAATQLAFTVQPPTNVTAGQPMMPAVQVAIEDASGRVVTNATNLITINIGTNPSGGVLTGGGATSPVNGVATFSSLSINNAGTGYTLSASATSPPVLANATSNSFNATTGPAVVTSNASAVFPIFAPGPTQNFTFTVSNDSAPDTITVTLTVDANTGLACTTATCGTLPGGGLVATAAGTAGSGSYSVVYTPPASLAAQTFPTLLVTSSITGSFAATDSIEVDPAGVPLVALSCAPGCGIHLPNMVTRTITALVYNDSPTATNQGVTFSLTASGYACSNIGANSCGTLSGQSAPLLVSPGVTQTTITYTPPTSTTPPAPPYDRPRIQATSVFNTTQLASIYFLIDNTAPANTGLRIPAFEKVNSALAPTATGPLIVDANIGNDTGNLRTVTWKLTSGGSSGADCSGPCGTLSAATATGNGTFVSSEITYTPPATLPTVAADLTPTITATSVDNPAATDSFTFNIVDGSCPSPTATTNGRLSGQYAFLLRGRAGQGYGALIGSFTADGSGHITGGFYDANRNLGVFTDVPIVPTGSSYSVGADNRGCLYLNDASGFPFVFRFSLGTLVSGIATEGRIIRFEDITGRGPRQSGVLMKQNPASFTASALSGPYAFGLEGVDANGGRQAVAGILTATTGTGGGAISNFTADVDTPTMASGVTASGQYIMASNAPSGRGTVTLTFNGTGAPTIHSVIYMVSTSEFLLMNTDPIAQNHAILSGEGKKRQTTTFAQTMLDGKSYVFHMAGISNSDGTNESTFGQFNFSTNGNATGVIDDNGNPENPVSATFTIDPTTGRMIISSGGGTHPPIFYLVNSGLAFVVDTSSSVASGLLEQQTGGPFTTASITGQYFFGTEAPTIGAEYNNGAAMFTPSTGMITGTSDSSRNDGLQPNKPIDNGGTPPTPVTYCFNFTTSPACTPAATASGQGNVGGSLAYIISPQKLIFTDTRTENNGTKNRRVFVIQQ